MDTGLSTLPLAAVSSVLTALDVDEADLEVGPTSAQALDKAGYESVSWPIAARKAVADKWQDGGEEVQPAPQENGKTKAWYWQFNKSPMGQSSALTSQMVCS